MLNIKKSYKKKEQQQKEKQQKLPGSPSNNPNLKPFGASDDETQQYLSTSIYHDK